MRRPLPLALLPPLTLLLLSGCASEPPAGPLVAGAEVTDPVRLIAAASDLLPDLLAGERAAVSPASSCYFARGSDGSYRDMLFCGPVAVQGGSGPWATLSVELTAVGHRPGALLGVGLPLEGSFALLGPSGERPPADLYLPPLPLPVGTLLARPTVPDSLLLTSRSGWSLGSPDPSSPGSSAALTVVSTATVESFGSGYDRLTAPDGSTLLVVELLLRPDVGVSDVAFALTGAGGQGTLVPLGVLERFVVMVVPEDASPQVRVSSGGVVQALDLRDGTRSGAAPRLWNEAPQVGLLDPARVERFFLLPPLQLPDRLVAGDVTVSASIALSVEDPVLRGPSGRIADPGMMLLPLRFQDVSLDSPSRYLQMSLGFLPSLQVDDGEVGLQYELETLPGSQLRMFLQVPEDAPLLRLSLQPRLFWQSRSFYGDFEGVVEAEEELREISIRW